jgi:hypothetical protein
MLTTFDSEHMVTSVYPMPDFSMESSDVPEEKWEVDRKSFPNSLMGDGGNVQLIMFLSKDSNVVERWIGITPKAFDGQVVFKCKDSPITNSRDDL